MPSVVRPASFEAPATASWFTPRRFALFLGFLVFASFPALLVGSQAFVFRDYGLFGYPLAIFQRDCFWRGELPLWDPLNYCGLPFLAQWNTMALYPPSLIYLLLPMPWALSVFCLVHLFWGGLGTYFLATEWTKHRLAASLAGVIFAFNGFMLCSLVWPSQVATLAWTPWLVWLVPSGWRQGGRKAARAVLLSSMQMLAGGPETILLTWTILTLLAAWDWVQTRGQRLKIITRFAVVVFLVASVCAAQLLPFLQLLARSQRDTGFGSSMWALPLSGWANFLVPLFETYR
ncbi:MAG TPA: hypothetical protein VHI52_12435, partial [Verrucomicrobiae bacterium]|nr:hypothetical protein [Verrucomicrobiae bacterium]